MKRIGLLLLLVVLASGSVFGETIRVPNDKPTIQAGIDAAVDGDTVLVANGTYKGEGNVNLDFKGKSITVKSAGGAKVCIVDCENIVNAGGFNFHSGETKSSVLDGFTITKTNAVTGILVTDSSSPTINNCVITNNVAEYGAGIVSTYSSKPVFNNCTIANNTAAMGGGGILCTRASAPIFNNCVIMNNSAAHGGGILCDSNTSPTFTDCEIINNQEGYSDRSGGNGGGIFCNNSTMTLTNCSLADNTSTRRGGGLFCVQSSIDIKGGTIKGNISRGSGGGIRLESSSLKIIDCTIVENKTTEGWGGGIDCQNSSPEITKCIIKGNSAKVHAGGILSNGDNSSPIITDCIIEGNTAEESAGGVLFHYDASPRIINSTIKSNSAGYGGGISCTKSSATISNCKIISNSSSSNSGGIYFGNASPILTDCAIANNVANGWAGGIHCAGNSSPIITNCDITRNTAKVHAGGIYTAPESSPSIINCRISDNVSKQAGGGILFNSLSGGSITGSTITGNTASYGGGITSTESSPIITNCSIIDNVATSSKGGGICGEHNSFPTVTNTIFWRNKPQEIYLNLGANISISHSDVQGGKGGIVIKDDGTLDWGAGNLDTDPLFIDISSGDYRLSDISLCIGAGTLINDTPKTDIEGNPRPVPIGSKPDMGAYESDLGSPATPVNIPDPNLRSALEKALGKNEGDAITKEDLEGLKELVVNGDKLAENEKIKDLTGLEHGTNLTKLALDFQQIDKVTPLSNLTNLTSLHLAYNPFAPSSLNKLTKFTKLQRLSLTGRNLKDLNGLSKLTNLVALHIWSLHLTDLSVFTPTNFPKLVDLALNDSRPTEADMMSLAKMVNLTRLNLRRSKLTDAHIKHLTALTNLGSLEISHNQITDITALSGLTQLTFLTLKENQIRDLSPLVQSTATFGGMIELRTNPLNNTAYTTHIPTLKARGITVESDDIPADIVTFKDSNLERAIRDALGIPTELLKKENLAGLKELHFNDKDGAKVTDLTGLEHCTDLEVLWLPFSPISDISNLSNLTKLNGLGLFHADKITNITPLSGLKSLNSLDLAGNNSHHFTDLTPLSKLNNLHSLVIAARGISDISSISNLTQLKVLQIHDNQISDISPLANFTNLKELHLYYNQISDLSPLLENSGLAGKIYLKPGYGDKENNPLSNTTYTTQIPALVKRGIAVEYDEPPADIIKMSDLVFENSLRQALNIPTEVLTEAQISSITSLDLTNTGLIDLDLEALIAFPQLKSITLTGNPLSKNAILEQIPDLKAMGIKVDLGTTAPAIVKLAAEQTELAASLSA
ncbi:MAG: right-handed parallel beta-helix repeat-containing protein, partial [Anaerolineales bacterium]|nr:right-handed parallel beta-helix repeat-containing protein [Anaerolineales bacterium]